MKKIFLLAFLFSIQQKLHAQELFVYTEPASNMAVSAVGLRFTNMMMKETSTGKTNYHLLPEMMIGVNKKLMLHAEAFISNRNNGLATEGMGFYGKYRFLSNDEVHAHFRMAAFGRYSFNNSDIHQEEIETNAHNSGYELGVVATQLINKVALSSSISYERAIDNGSSNKFPSTQSNNAVNYTFSIGKLLLPKEYTSYQQTNLNFMVEMLGQRLQNGKSFLDIAPAAQLIINSQARLDFSYRQQLYSNMVRNAPNGFLLRFEYTFFNVWK